MGMKGWHREGEKIMGGRKGGWRVRMERRGLTEGGRALNRFS